MASRTEGEKEEEEEEDVDSDFDLDDDIKEELNSLLNMPLEFMEDSSEEEGTENAKPPDQERCGDSVERELEALFVEDSGRVEAEVKDTWLENISENELDAPESGECDTSDGELPDSPRITVTLPAGADSDIELVDEYPGFFPPTNTQAAPTTKSRELQVVAPTHHKPMDSASEKPKVKEKKERSKKKSENSLDDETRKKLKLKKYLARLDQYRAKCLAYMSQINKKTEVSKKIEHKSKTEKNKKKNLDGVKLKSIVEKIEKNRESSPPRSTSSKIDQMTHTSSHCSRIEKLVEDKTKRRSGSFEKERKKSHKKSKSKTKELKEHKLRYQKYIQYLQSEREKCYETLDNKHKKSKKKHKKSASKSPEKMLVLDKKEPPPVMSFVEFCNSRELTSPDKEIPKKIQEKQTTEAKKERTISVDSLATTATVHSDPVDDDKELFITYSDLVAQDNKQQLQKDRVIMDDELEKDPALKSISVFTSVLFKGSTESSGIPFLREETPAPPSPKIVSIKHIFNQSSGPDDIYDWKDDLSNISQSSFSPSRSPPAPKIHNKALLNFMKNQEELVDKHNLKAPIKQSSKSSRSRSKSPKKEGSKLKKRKRKHHSSMSTVSPSPPPLRPRSPDMYKKRVSPPAYLKERWKDYPSPIERRREHYDRPPRIRRRSRSRTRGRSGHRSRSSSEDRHYRRYPRSRSHSRSRSRSRSPTAMVQISVADRRRKLKEEHERALASLRATISKPMKASPISIKFTSDGDNYDAIRDNYDPVVMNEVLVSRRRSMVAWSVTSNTYSSHSSYGLPPYPPPLLFQSPSTLVPQPPIRFIPEHPLYPYTNHCFHPY